MVQIAAISFRGSRISALFISALKISIAENVVCRKSKLGLYNYLFNFWVIGQEGNINNDYLAMGKDH